MSTNNNTRKIRDLTGLRFGLLTAQHVNGIDSTKKTLWLCSCDCGRTVTTTMLNLTKGNTKSCGCLRARSRRRDLTGLRFGSLVAVVPKDSLRWACKCDCGRGTVVRTVHLTRNHTRSCGLCIPLNASVAHATRRRRNATSAWIRATKAGGVCDACGSTSMLHAHHIMPFADYPAGHTALENGACLCVACHRKVHKKIAGKCTPGLALAEVITAHRGPPFTTLLSTITNVEDLRKARHYLNKLIEEVTK